MNNRNISHNPESFNPENAPKRILITGGCGFIGSNLVEYLIKKGYRNITLYDNLSTGNKSYIERILSKFGEFEVQKKNESKIVYNLILNPESLILTLVRGDILDFDKLEKVTKEQDAVIHLAAHTRVLESLDNPENNININTKGTFNVIEAARKNEVEKFIFASSNAAVGEQIPPINEDMIPKPLSPYGASKLFGEGLCSSYYNFYGIKTAALRFANVYGPYSEHKTSVIAKFIKRAKQGKTLEIYGDGNQTRDFIHVSDIAQAIHLSLNPYHSNPKISPYGEIYQIATGVETKIIDLAEMIDEVVKGENDIKFTEERKGEIKENYSDISKARELLGFRPNIKLEKGISEVINKLVFIGA